MKKLTTGYKTQGRSTSINTGMQLQFLCKKTKCDRKDLKNYDNKVEILGNIIFGKKRRRSICLSIFFSHCMTLFKMRGGELPGIS